MGDELRAKGVKLPCISEGRPREAAAGATTRQSRAVSVSSPKRLQVETCAHLLGWVADRYGVPVSLLRFGGNHRVYVVPRSMAMYLCQECLGMSLTDTGKAFGGYHHTTVWHAVGKVRRALETGEPGLAEFVAEAREQVASVNRRRGLYAPDGVILKEKTQ
jgi:hypothetical protein